MRIAFTWMAVLCAAGLSGCAGPFPADRDPNAMAVAVQEALQAGKAVAMTPLPAWVPDSARRPGGRYLRDDTGNGEREFTLAVQWQNTATGTLVNLADTFTTAVDMRPLSGTRYLVTIIEPGTYRLAGSRHESGFTVDTLKAGPRPPSNVGTVTFQDNMSTEQHWEWQLTQPRYATKTRQTTTCGGYDRTGNCVAPRVTTSQFQVVEAPAKYERVSTTVPVRNVVAETRLTADFATFTVRPGEVLLTDTLYERLPNPPRDDGACEKVADGKLTCSLKRYTLYQQPAQADLVRQRLAQKAPVSRLYSMLGLFQYRPLTITAAKGPYDPAWMQEYHLPVDP